MAVSEVKYFLRCPCVRDAACRSSPEMWHPPHCCLYTPQRISTRNPKPSWWGNFSAAWSTRQIPSTDFSQLLSFLGPWRKSCNKGPRTLKPHPTVTGHQCVGTETPLRTSRTPCLRASRNEQQQRKHEESL